MSLQHQEAITGSVNPELSLGSRLLTEAVLRRFVGKLECGELVVEIPAGDRLILSGRKPGPQAEVTVHRWRCLWRLAYGWDIGFAEAYCAGELTSPDLTSLLRFASYNSDIRSPLKFLRAPRF